jgi:hypothetical protein
MLRKLLVIFAVLSLFGCGGCASNTGLHPVLSGPELASRGSSNTLALITNLGDADPSNSPFCTAVWVGKRTILTANHCLEGYAKMVHNVAMVRAMVSEGVPVQIAVMVIRGGLYDADPNDPDMSDTGKALYQIMHSVPPVNPDTLDIPFIVQSEVIDMGVSPVRMHHSFSITRSVKEDLALLDVRGDCPEHSIVAVADKAPVVGEKIEVVGHVKRNYWFYREGVVGAYRHSLKESGMENIDGPFMQISAPLSFGDSGGGVFNQRGELVGINSFIDQEVPGAYCIHVDTIRGFLAGQHVITLKLDPASKDPDLKDASINW